MRPLFVAGMSRKEPGQFVSAQFKSGFSIVTGCSTRTIALICLEGGGDRSATITLQGGHSNVRMLVPFRRG